MNTVKIKCEEINMDQEFLVEDLPELIKDLRNLSDDDVKEFNIKLTYKNEKK